MALKYHEVQQREEIVSKLLAEGKSISQMAKAVGVTQQSMHKFLKVRGWKTVNSKIRDKETVDQQTGKKLINVTKEQKARAKKRKALKKVIDRG